MEKKWVPAKRLLVMFFITVQKLKPQTAGAGQVANIILYNSKYI